MGKKEKVKDFDPKQAERNIKARASQVRGFMKEIDTSNKTRSLVGHLTRSFCTHRNEGKGYALVGGKKGAQSEITGKRAFICEICKQPIDLNSEAFDEAAIRAAVRLISNALHVGKMLGSGSDVKKDWEYVDSATALLQVLEPVTEKTLKLILNNNKKGKKKQNSGKVGPGGVVSG